MKGGERGEVSTISIRIVGVGGQGIVLASNLLGEVALAAGLDVKKAEVHGMSQRGGSVTCDVRFGEKVFSPLTAPGDVDLIIAFERLEALRNLPALKPDGVIVVNRQSIAPSTVIAGMAVYPPDVDERLRQQAARLIFVDGPRIALDLGDPRVINSAVLGAASPLLPFSLEQWEEAFQARLKNKGVEINLQAFLRGRAEAESVEAAASGLPTA
jgi:indolepyruvate ferredoxin oxidoreductase beta subunit